ncbi:MAG: ABC transporter permease [Lachnospiraceae bacterium]|nr:ABC transporter permease [Lachnospiraceae bacterium]
MRITELLRLVWMNINQNKFKSVLTSIGIVAGAATIVLVIGIGKGGQMEVAEQFAELNAGAIDVTYEYEREEDSQQGFSFRNIKQLFGNMFGGGASAGGDYAVAGRMRMGESGQQGASATDMNQSPGQMPDQMANQMPDQMGAPAGDRASGAEGGDAGTTAADARDGIAGTSEEDSGQEEAEAETSMVDDRLNHERIILTQDDVEEIELFVSGISGATISYSTRASVEGGTLQSAQTYTVAGVKESFQEVSRLEMTEGEFLTEEMDAAKEKSCVLGATAAKELFGSAGDALDEILYLDDRAYTVVGILEFSQSVASGISPDTAILIPYETGIKYISGTEIDPVLTVIAEDVNVLDQVIADVETVLEENHINARFTFEDSGSKMQAAQSSNRTLTMLLSAMAVIVFLVGGIGIMNVLFVSVKERTNEIGILKAIGTPKGQILIEFLIESAAISMIGGVLGVAVSFAVIPVAGYLNVRVEVGLTACLSALGFAVLTGTLFGIYPAWKASRLEPVEALNAE